MENRNTTIAVIGASHGIGYQSVKNALARGLYVNALSKSGMDFCHPEMTDIHGDALKENDLRKVLNGADAAIVTLGTRGSTRKTTLFSDFARTLTGLHVKESLTIPIIVLTGFGTGESVKYHSWYTRIPFRLLLGKVYDDKALMENIITSSSLQWEIVRPWVMNDGSQVGRYAVKTIGADHYSLLPVARKKVADFLVSQAVKPTFLKQKPAIFHR